MPLLEMHVCAVHTYVCVYVPVHVHLCLYITLDYSLIQFCNLIGQKRGLYLQ